MNIVFIGASLSEPHINGKCVREIYYDDVYGIWYVRHGDTVAKFSSCVSYIP